MSAELITAALARALYRYLPVWCVVAMLGFAAAAAPLFARDLWTDEAFSASYTSHTSVSALLEDVRKNEETPPGYFIALWGWSKLAGTGETALRMLSLLCGLLAAALFAVLSRRWLAPHQAVVAALVFALSPVLARYLVEVRGYTLLLLLAVLCIAVFEWLRREPRHPGALAAYVLAAAALFLTTYFGTALLVAHNLIWAARLVQCRAGWPRRLAVWCVAQLAVALLILPWLPALLYQLKVAPAVSPFQNARPEHYFWLLLMLPMHAPPNGAWSVLWLLLAVAGWGLVILALRRPTTPEAGLVLRTFVAPGMVLLALIIWMQAIGPRYLITLLPGAALAIGVGSSVLQRRAPRLAAAMTTACLIGLVIYRLSGAAAPAAGKPWSALVPQLASRADPAGDVVLLHPPYEQRTFAYYYHGPALPMLGAHDYDDYYDVQGHSLQAAWTQADAIAATKGYRRIWLFYNPLLGSPRLELPYRSIGHWRSAELELTLYDVSRT